MRVRVRLFARYREAAGQERLDVEVPDEGTVETAWSAVVGRHPVLSPYRPFTLFAVGATLLTQQASWPAPEMMSMWL